MLASQLEFLVVEDHEFQRRTLIRILHGLGARQVHSATDGHEALKVLATLPAPPDIILTDLNMPGMDGIEFIRHLGLAQHGASLIVISALERSLLSSVGTMAKAYGMNLMGFVEKPVTPRKLEELIDRRAPPSASITRERRDVSSISIGEIRGALKDRLFEPFFQAKVEVATSRVLGAEALARWHHPVHGMLGPESFLAILEEAGEVNVLFEQILEKAAHLCRRMHDAGHQGIICVNLSLKQLADLDLAERITAVVRSAGIEPRHITLEVTESAATENLGPALENLARLRMRGFGLGIDDYGTGYASLEQLTRIPFNELKIDQSFVRQATRQDSVKVILESSIEMTRKLNIVVVAEGVETQANWDLLCDLKCDAAQGYYISRPLPADDFLEWLESWRRLQTF